MLKLKQFNSLIIQELVGELIPKEYHSQNYYELVYIFEGSGIHLLNQLSTSYSAGDLFIVSQEDTHFFEQLTATKIIVIKFTDSYFSQNKYQTFQNESGFHPESIMNNKSLKEMKLHFSDEVKILMKSTIKNILDYSKINEITNSPVLFYQILSVFGMIKETMDKMYYNLNDNLPDKEFLTAYIHQNIYDPEKIKVDFIAEHFNISATYFSSYFKRKFAMSYRNYIDQYRMKLIDQRLISARKSMKEIADEFGFNDGSHFSHYYKNKKGFSPSFYLGKTKNKDEFS